MADMTDLERPLIVVGGRLQAFSARCSEHSATVSAMLVVNDVEFRQLMAQSPALVAVLDRSMEFTSETLQFLQAIAADLHKLTTMVIEDNNQRRAVETILANVHSRCGDMIQDQETDDEDNDDHL